jgi:hypothetical protein
MTGKKAIAGGLIGLICLIKPQLGLFIIWGSLRKQWRFVIGILVIVGIFGIISLSVYGFANHLDYSRVLAFISKHGESYYPNQSVNGLLHRLLSNGPNIVGSAHHFAPYHRWVYAGTMVSSLFIIATALVWQRGQFYHAATLDFTIAALSFTMASPVAWEHHYSIMLPIFAVALPATLASNVRRWGVVLLAVSFVLSSNFYPITLNLANTRFNLLQSYLFFGAVILLFHLYRLRDIQQQTINRNFTI